MESIKYVNFIEISPVVIEIQGVENVKLAVPVNNTLVCHTAFLAADTWPCVLILLFYYYCTVKTLMVKNLGKFGILQHYAKFFLLIFMISIVLLMVSQLPTTHQSRKACFLVCHYLRLDLFIHGATDIPHASGISTMGPCSLFFTALILPYS